MSKIKLHSFRTHNQSWAITSIVPAAIFFMFGFFGSLTEEGWLGLGLTVGLTALFIAGFAAGPTS